MTNSNFFHDKKSVKRDMTEEYININIDLNDIPFTKKDDENIIIAISGKTFEMLYYKKKKYESKMMVPNLAQF